MPARLQLVGLHDHRKPCFAPCWIYLVFNVTLFLIPDFIYLSSDLLHSFPSGKFLTNPIVRKLFCFENHKAYLHLFVSIQIDATSHTCQPVGALNLGIFLNTSKRKQLFHYSAVLSVLHGYVVGVGQYECTDEKQITLERYSKYVSWVGRTLQFYRTIRKATSVLRSYTSGYCRT